MFMLGKSPMVTTTLGVRDLGCGHNPTSAPGSAATGKTSGRCRKRCCAGDRSRRIFTFRNDNEQTRWLPTNIKHVSEVSRYDDQVNRYSGDI